MRTTELISSDWECLRTNRERMRRVDDTNLSWKWCSSSWWIYSRSLEQRRVWEKEWQRKERSPVSYIPVESVLRLSEMTTAGTIPAAASSKTRATVRAKIGPERSFILLLAVGISCVLERSSLISLSDVLRFESIDRSSSWLLLLDLLY